MIYIKILYEFYKNHVKLPFLQFFFNFCSSQNDEETKSNNHTYELQQELSADICITPTDTETYEKKNTDIVMRRISYSDINLNEIHEISISQESISKYINHNYIEKTE
jgi:hypothetical protein